MTEILLTSKPFVITGLILAVITTLSIFKKLFKVGVISFVILLFYGAYTLKTGKNPREILETINKGHKVNNYTDSFKHTTVEAIEAFDKAISTDVNKVKKKANKAFDDIIPNDSKKDIKTFSNKFEKEKKKAKKKIKEELNKYKKHLKN